MQHLALTYKAPYEVEACSVVTGAIDQGEMLIGIDFAGVCGTDLDILRGARAETPRILGHEGVGRVLESRAAGADYAAGASVIFNPVSAFDQHDILGHTFPGIWQAKRLITAKEIAHGHVVPCESNLPAVTGTLIEPLGTVLYGLGLMRQCVELNSIAIVGSGMIGLLFAVEARRQGVGRIILLGPSRARLDWAIAQDIVSDAEAMLVERHNGQILERSRLEDACDAVVVCTPRAAAACAIATATDIVRPRGVIDLVGGIRDQDRNAALPKFDLNAVRRANVRGLPAAGIAQPAVTSRGKHLYLTGHRGTHPNHLHGAAAILAARDSRHACIITHVVPLGQAREVFTRLLLGNERHLAGRHVVKLVLELNGRLQEIISNSEGADLA